MDNAEIGDPRRPAAYQQAIDSGDREVAPIAADRLRELHDERGTGR